MARLRIAFLGDVVGEPGRRAFAHACGVLRRDRGAHVVIVNGENARHGRGLHPDGYDELIRGGADAITLGDHAFDDERIAAYLNRADAPVACPVNFPLRSDKAKRWNRIAPTVAGTSELPNLYTVTVLGRVYMKQDNGCPFEFTDEAIRTITGNDPEALVIVEIHAEVTSEKMGMAHHCAQAWGGTVVGVVGTHTHVQTNDARLIPVGAGGFSARQLGAISDLGMTGGHASVIGFDPDESLHRLRTQTGGKLSPSERDIAASGVMLVVDTTERSAVSMEALRIPLDR
ncbi:MAG: YmdB family metallophosphoesterase [Phycisphaerales bacterium JB065]